MDPGDGCPGACRSRISAECLFGRGTDGHIDQQLGSNKADVGYSLNRSCPAQRVALGRSDLAKLNQRPGPMTFSYRSCSTYVNSPEADIARRYYAVRHNA
jgi:hypothetical protein